MRKRALLVTTALLLSLWLLIAIHTSQATPKTVSPPISDLVSLVDANRYFGDIETLAEFQTRRTHTTGNHNARNWLQIQFQQMGLHVSLDEFTMSQYTCIGYDSVYNVVAEIPGRVRPDDVYIVGAHFDSISDNEWYSAPGAEDNASGVAGVLETARIFVDHPPEATVRFIAFNGEEESRCGSKAYVADLKASETLSQVQAALIMDMISFTSDETLDVMLETYPWAASVRDVMSESARLYTTLDVAISDDPWGSDHRSFLDENVKSVLAIEQEWDEYPGYHSTDDTPDQVTPAQGAEVVKMIVASLAQLAGSCALADLNCDDTINSYDVNLVAGRWNTHSQGDGYDWRYDPNHDGKIDIADVQRVSSAWNP
ncbi:MAG TPA: M20/M25/M40 family metallo-hydrolase [Anaerolineae bacterium]|nr:M20/M25/M40 family metallo-hydrolase [Anaerolineae bacterium]